MYSCHVSLLSNTQGSFVRFIVKTSFDKIVVHLTNSSLFKKRFFNRPIRFPGSNFDSGEINGNVIGSAGSKDLTACARGLSPISTTYSNVPCRWRARRPLASRVLTLLLCCIVCCLPAPQADLTRFRRVILGLRSWQTTNNTTQQQGKWILFTKYKQN